MRNDFRIRQSENENRTTHQLLQRVSVKMMGRYEADSQIGENNKGCIHSGASWCSSGKVPGRLQMHQTVYADRRFLSIRPRLG